MAASWAFDKEVTAPHGASWRQARGAFRIANGTRRDKQTSLAFELSFELPAAPLSTVPVDVRIEPTTTVYGDLRFLVESRLAASRASPTLTVEVGRASGLVARAADRTLGATGGFFLGASAGATY